MYRSIYGLIPARAGSKGIPRKNLALVGDRPMIDYTVQAAKNSTKLDRIYISTNDENVQSLYKDDTSVNLLKRPDELSADESTADDVVRHFIGSLGPEIIDLNPLIVYLQPTSPLRTSKHIDAALSKFIFKNASSLVSVFQIDNSIMKAMTLDGLEVLHSLVDLSPLGNLRQNLPSLYMPNGAIYIFPAKEFIRVNRFPLDRSIPYIMTEDESVDIDSMSDLYLANELLKKRMEC